jgi:cytochrome o ubiquinol oxidase subunit 2
MTMIVGGLTWYKTYQLDPYKPLAADRKEMTIQVVALQWKWLFIYPDEGVASVNFFQIPKDTPIRFELTADAPMNSFWIPHLGGQIYAMPAMRTKLNLIADEVGDFRGSSANISGEGFAGMSFIARASSEEDYRRWINEAKRSPQGLNWNTYTQLVKPTQYVPPKTFRLQDSEIFGQIINKYMHPARKS